MRLEPGRHLALLALAGLLALGATSARGAFLTGAVLYSTDAAGAPSSGEYWNTVGGDNRYNLYVAIGPNDPILNPGDGSSTSLNLPLPVGTYTYDIFGAGATPIDHYALALYFNGNTSPSIVAYTATGSSTTPTVVSTADGSVTLGTTPTASPNSLTLVDSTTTVTLDGLTWTAPTAGGLDLVSGYSNTPGASPNFFGSFTLSVSPNGGSFTPAPEPASMVLLGLGVVGAGVAARRRKVRASA